MTRSLKGSAELLGMVAIVASLIFVGLELRQSQYQARISFNVDYFQNMRDYTLSQAGERLRSDIGRYDLQPALLEKLNGLTDLELGDYVTDGRQILYMFDNIHYQYQSDFIDEDK